MLENKNYSFIIYHYISLLPSSSFLQAALTGHEGMGALDSQADPVGWNFDHWAVVEEKGNYSPSSSENVGRLKKNYCASDVDESFDNRQNWLYEPEKLKVRLKSIS